MRIEVDEDLLTGLRGRYHPHALLGGRVGTGIPRGGEVVRGVDLYVPPAFICAIRQESWSVGGHKLTFTATELNLDTNCSAL